MLDVQLYIHTFPASGVHVLIKFFVAFVLRRQTSHPSHECREHDVGWDWKDTHGGVFGTPLPQCRTLSSHSHSKCRDMEVEMRFDCFKSTCKALQQSLGLVPIEHCLHCPYCTNRLCKMAAPLGQTGASRTSQKKLGRMLGLLSLMMVCRSVVSSSCHI
jgi:hypothetical protein